MDKTDETKLQPRRQNTALLSLGLQHNRTKPPGVPTMFLANRSPEHGRPLEAAYADLLGAGAADEVERFLRYRDSDAATPLLALPALAAELGVGALHLKDEGRRLDLGSFKALGGAYAVMRLSSKRRAACWGGPWMLPICRATTCARWRRR
jgi:hypothetical protein